MEKKINKNRRKAGVSAPPSIAQPLISVVIPVYNVEPYIRQCLDSVLSQSYQPLDIIIIDDGSTDNSGKICDDYAAKNGSIRVFHKENEGLAATWNFGLDRVPDETERIVFIDSDDWMEKDAISTMYEVSKQNHADIVCCGFCEEFPDRCVPSDERNDTVIVTRSDVLDAYLCDSRIKNYTWNKMYKATMFSDIRFPVDRKCFQDVVTVYRVLEKAHRIAIIPNRLFHYRIRSGGNSKRHRKGPLINCWNSYHERYQVLESKVRKEESKVMLITGCLWAMGRIQRWYYSFSKTDRAEMDQTLQQMHLFANKHSSEIMHSKSYKLKHKLSCVCAKTNSRFLMFVFYLITRIHHHFEDVRKAARLQKKNKKGQAK